MTAVEGQAWDGWNMSWLPDGVHSTSFTLGHFLLLGLLAHLQHTAEGHALMPGHTMSTTVPSFSRPI
jgi:hypothetical protein